MESLSFVIQDEKEPEYKEIPLDSVRFFTVENVIPQVYDGPKGVKVVYVIDFIGRIEVKDGTLFDPIVMHVHNAISKDGKISLPFPNSVQGEDISNFS